MSQRYVLIVGFTSRPRWSLGLVKRKRFERFVGRPGKTRAEALKTRMEMLTWPGVESVRMQEEEVE